jgi:hypothetical protein
MYRFYENKTYHQEEVIAMIKSFVERVIGMYRILSLSIAWQLMTFSVLNDV